MREEAYKWLAELIGEKFDAEAVAPHAEALSDGLVRCVLQ